MKFVKKNFDLIGVFYNFKERDIPKICGKIKEAINEGHIYRDYFPHLHVVVSVLRLLVDFAFDPCFTMSSRRNI